MKTHNLQIQLLLTSALSMRINFKLLEEWRIVSRRNPYMKESLSIDKITLFQASLLNPLTTASTKRHISICRILMTLLRPSTTPTYSKTQEWKNGSGTRLIIGASRHSKRSLRKISNKSNLSSRRWLPRRKSNWCPKKITFSASCL